MYDKRLINELFQNIEESLLLIVRQTESLSSISDLLATPTGILILDGICMNLLAVGETVKSINKYTGKELLTQYPSIPWKDVMKMRDVIAHHYFEVDAEIVFNIIRNDVPPLLAAVRQIREDLKLNP
ncbi:MAG: DUF86 domain-containing protein [Tannerella sp.]|jgi:uncharacterized protein with HEPN domain|nr:DUF86 domain-containing protein [Tannerella sp.]